MSSCVNESVKYEIEYLVHVENPRRGKERDCTETNGLRISCQDI